MKELVNKFCIPVWTPHRITGEYGKKRTLPDGKKDTHKGIDFVSKTGCCDVFAVYDGKVIFDQDDYDHKKRWSKGHTGGNMLILEHRVDGVVFYTRYLHLSSNIKSKGDIVYKGNMIGTYADVGYSFGAHLHFDCFDYQWKRIDPTSFFKNLYK